jgi:hypothetical protein
MVAFNVQSMRNVWNTLKERTAVWLQRTRITCNVQRICLGVETGCNLILVSDFFVLIHVCLNKMEPKDHLIRWVHTCTVMAYRNAVTLQVIDTKRSYDRDFHPMPHDVTVFCELCTMEFPVFYGSQKHHECKEG